MSLRLNGSTSGYSEIDAPAVAGSNTLVLPGGNGSADQALVTNGSGTLSFADRGRMVLETAQSATGTAIYFTDIPDWVKRATVILDLVSTNGTSLVQVQLGSGSYQTTGYYSMASLSGGVNVALGEGSFSGMVIAGASAALLRTVSMVIIRQYGNVYVSSHFGGLNNPGVTNYGLCGGGNVTLGGTLDRLRVTTINGTDTFDAGTINLLLEG
jgi:hypothetical protein